MTETKARLTLRQGTSTLWASVNPVLLAGEPGFETDTHILRIGDGSTTFTSLPEIRNVADIGGAYQASNATLTSLAGLTLANNKGLYATGGNTIATFDLTPFGRTFLSKTTAAEQRTALELGTAALLGSSTATNLATDPSQLAPRSTIKAAIDAAIAAIDISPEFADMGSWYVTPGGVGTYVFAKASSDVTFGTTIAGSSLTPTGAICSINAGTADNTGSQVSLDEGTSLTGTWQCMGTHDNSNTASWDGNGSALSFRGATLWQRVV